MFVYVNWCGWNVFIKSQTKVFFCLRLKWRPSVFRRRFCRYLLDICIAQWEDEDVNWYMIGRAEGTTNTKLIKLLLPISISISLEISHLRSYAFDLNSSSQSGEEMCNDAWSSGARGLMRFSFSFSIRFLLSFSLIFPPSHSSEINRLLASNRI